MSQNVLTEDGEDHKQGRTKIRFNVELRCFICVCLYLLGKSDLQVRGEVLSRCECVLPDCQVGNVVDGEAEFR